MVERVSQSNNKQTKKAIDGTFPQRHCIKSKKRHKRKEIQQVKPERNPKSVEKCTGN